MGSVPTRLWVEGAAMPSARTAPASAQWLARANTAEGYTILVAKHEIRIAKHETMTANLYILVSCFDFNFMMAASIITSLCRSLTSSTTLLSPPSTATVWSTATATMTALKQKKTA